MSEYTLAFDSSLCIACYGCSTACKAWRDVPLGLDWCRVEKKWTGKDLKARPFYYGVYCQHCVDAPCIPSCPEEALSKDAASGAVKLDAAKCNACKVCLEACPYGVPQFPESGPMQKCDLCLGVMDLEKEEPPCVRTCPPKALTLKKVTPEEKKAQAEALTAILNMPYYEE